MALTKYKVYRNLLTKLKRISKINYFKDKCEEYQTNIKNLWQIMNTCIGKCNDKTNIIDYIRVGNIDIYDSHKIANEWDITSQLWVH